MKLIIRCLSIMSIASLLVACASSPPTNYYRLIVSDQNIQNIDKQLSILVKPIRLPEILSQQHVLSHGSHKSTLIRSNLHLWVSDLENMFLDVVVQDLKKQLPSSYVFGFPAPKHFQPDLNIHITVDEFIGSLGGDVTLAVQWLVVDAEDKILIKNSEKFSTATDSETYVSYVNALSDLISQLNTKIAQEISVSL